MKHFLLIFLINVICIEIKANVTSSEELQNKDEPTKLLSRRKRFLIFPDGSSFQIVFCTQNHGYLQLGNIVWFGTTAALAWELPTDPGAFDMFKDLKAYQGQRRQDILYYVDEDGKIVDKVEYKRKILINPALAKRSVDAAERNKRNITKFNIKEMHKLQKNKMLFENLDATRIEHHRTERQEIYAKLEKFLQTLGLDGKECILKMLCVTGKQRSKQASFVAEILRAVFTLPKVPDTMSKVHKHYHDAPGSNGDCSELYPKCEAISME
ncbi:hypothetical protein HW555_003701 [Spodoptera exigua]|uniref:Uncharacterized protein n=1 Tax=Spodoptera exigua TaxID=7107 RepID=A0A835GKK2_SPOEX|nr:hypothetical protein HW555_003701 [Spodoptera exigua]